MVFGQCQAFIRIRRTEAAALHIGTPCGMHKLALPLITASDKNSTDIHCAAMHCKMVMGMNAILAFVVMELRLTLNDTNVYFFDFQILKMFANIYRTIWIFFPF